MKTINIKLSVGTADKVPVLFETAYYVVIPIIEAGKPARGWQVATNDGELYKTIAKLGNKRLAIRLARYLQKNCNNKAIAYGNKYYIMHIVKDMLIDWLLDHRCYSAMVGNRPLVECR